MISFNVITQGILFGLTLSLMIGPAFFSLIQTSITQGFRSGSQLAIGVALSDIIMVFIAWFGVSSLFATENAQRLISIIGGSIIIGFGIYTATRKHITETHRKIDSVNKFQFKHILKGFVFNIANPGVWIYWLIPVNVAVSHNRKIEQVTFLLCILLTVFTMDLIKCAIAYELKRFMTDRVITIMNRVVGSILILFGVYLVLSSFPFLDIPSISTSAQ
jgi:threonine/homoserine/homoserine lactone efflux protein